MFKVQKISCKYQQTDFSFKMRGSDITGLAFLADKKSTKAEQGDHELQFSTVSIHELHSFVFTAWALQKFGFTDSDVA